MDKITELVYKIYGNIGKKDGKGFDEVIEGCKEYQQLIGYSDNEMISFEYVPELKYTDAKISVVCTLAVNGKEYTKSRDTGSIKTLVHEEDFVRTGAMVLLELNALIYLAARTLFEEVVLQNDGSDRKIFETVHKMAAKRV